MPDATHPTREDRGREGGRLVDFPSEHLVAGSPNNLPSELSSFVGREEEMAEVGRLLEDSRLLTLTGSGGCGKTRLALAAAGDLAEGFGDGVWLVELVPLADRSLVPDMVASPLGVRGQPGRPPAETLSEHIGPKNMLLVLDNCEHVVEACAALLEALLRSCPGLRILAPSREALASAAEAAWRGAATPRAAPRAPGGGPRPTAGEVPWPVPSLSLPDLRRLPDTESLSRYEAARLFLERAVAVNPTFALTEHNAPAVAQICYRLDGIPLALELAAARAKV